MPRSTLEAAGLVLESGVPLHALVPGLPFPVQDAGGVHVSCRSFSLPRPVVTPLTVWARSFCCLVTEDECGLGSPSASSVCAGEGAGRDATGCHRGHPQKVAAQWRGSPSWTPCANSSSGCSLDSERRCRGLGEPHRWIRGVRPAQLPVATRGSIGPVVDVGSSITSSRPWSSH